ncbi:uncharacterized protein LOC114971263 isoform X3 [Acropora millepora]|uniref:uncharacterized protein LOC114971263 isoform X3 n=1 Tax=Acropora millepora TaxID=45264 RepID=UPI001CF2D8BA|nr:uncharacterized protein LOC114971263 isoform X3 [Acropora millepora]
MSGECVSLPGPLCGLLTYDPSFKVEVRLHEPLWKVQFSPDDVAIEVLTLCSQLEPLCKREYATSSGGIDDAHKVEYQNKFEPKAQVLLEKMKEVLQFLPDPRPTLKEYLRQTGLSLLFPRVTSYLTNPDRPAFQNQKSSMDGYFSHLGMLNQLLTLGHQLNSDAFNLTNHKYLAHQTALLYQSVNQAGPPLAEYKKNIESNFKSLKASLVPKDKDSIPKLPQNQKEWVNNITANILDGVQSLPPSLTQPMISAMTFVEQQR